MKLFIDTLDLKEIVKYSELGIISGATTNPTFSKRFGMKDDIDTIEQVSTALVNGGEIHVEAFGDTAEEIISEAYRISGKTENVNNQIVYKIPFSMEGVKATSILSKEGFKTNLHLIYTINQAMLSLAARSTYICPLAGRLDDIGHDAIENIKNMKMCFDKNFTFTPPEIMVSSVRNPQHVIQAAKIGVDAITVPPSVLSSMFQHPLTTNGFDTFKKDLENM